MGKFKKAAWVLWSMFAGVPLALGQTNAAPTVPPTLTTEQIQAAQKAAQERLLTDFADLAHYAQANAALPSPALAQPRVVFIGDSITQFWATIDPEFFAFPGYVDRGISGQTTPQMLVRFRQDVVALKPAVVHIMAGTNDIAGNTGPMDLSATEANIASMGDLAQANAIQVVLGSVLPAADFWWHPGLNPGPRIAALNTWLKSYANSRGLVYVDYYAALTDGKLGIRADLAPDGVHPSREGYRVMDPMAVAAIRAATRHRARRH
jgi:lysophospholipase L1-like esterase